MHHLKIPLAFFGLFLICGSLRAQVVITPGVTVAVQQGTSMVLSQNLGIQAGGALNSDGNIIMNAGSFGDTGMAVFTGHSSLVYNGTAAQQLYTVSPLTIGTLVLNNNTGLAPNNSITITDSLLLVNGIYYADTSFPLFFANGAANPVESNGSRIVGRAILNPVVTGTDAINFLGCSMAAGSDLGTVSLVRTSGPDAVAVIAPGDTSIAQSWLIGTSNNAADPARDVTFSWLSGVDNGRNMASMYLYASPYPFTRYTLVSDTAQDVSATDPREYSRAGVSNLQRLFTLSDHGPSAGINIVNTPVVKLTAFPNPFGSVLSLNISKNDDDAVQVRVMDMTGKTMLANTYKAGRSSIIALNELGSLAAGSYLVQVYNDHFARSLKVVKSN